MSKKRLEVNLKWASYDILKQLYRTEKSVKIKTRILILLYFLEGYDSLGVSRLIHQSDFIVRRILHRYNKFGFEGLYDRKHNTTPTILSDNELFDIYKALSKCPRNSGLNYNNWTAKLLVEFVKNNFDKTISVNTAYSVKI